MESILDLAGGAAEAHPIAAVGYGIDRETLRLQPSRDLGEIRRARTESIRVLLWCEPFVIVRRRRIPLLHEELVESGLLSSRRLENQHEAPEIEGRRNCPLVEPGLRQRVDVSVQTDSVSVLDAG